MILSNLLCTDVNLADIPTIVATAGRPTNFLATPIEAVRYYDVVPCIDEDEQGSMHGNKWSEASDSDDEELQQIRETGHIDDCPIDPARATYTDEQYLDRPDIEAVEELDDEQWDQGFRNNSIDGSFASRRRFTLHPDILRVCRQVRDEGYPLLYDNKTIEVTFLRGFDDVTKYYHAEYSRRSFCMGRRSIMSALRKWPALKSFQNWAYKIYIGPCEERDNPGRKEESLTGLNHDLHTLYGLNIDKLTIGCFKAYDDTIPDSDDSETESHYPDVDDITIETCVMPFYTQTYNSVMFEGDIAPHMATQLQHYLLQPRLLPLFETWCMINDLAHKMSRDLKLRNLCTCFEKSTAQIWRPSGGHPCSSLRAAQEVGDLDQFYMFFNDYMGRLDRGLKEASRCCTICESQGQPLQEGVLENLEMLQERWHEVALCGAVPMPPELYTTWEQQKASWQPNY